ncbi:unnamed protein product [Microthlaspi erraticum]|uniref:CCHC-type domain-containing protein n=1 Tax=Microthlaspi erraticum TaxID=1685480 RepID=A0A6D2J6R3_9BRAS|nr:unnamed protein product [Microthlaspi erraticum]
MGLDESIYGAVKSALLSRVPLPTLEEAYNTLSQDEESKLVGRMNEERIEGVSFVVQTTQRGVSDNRGNNLVVCTFCNKTGHLAENCFRKIDYPPWFGEKNKTKFGSAYSRGPENNGGARATAASSTNTPKGRAPESARVNHYDASPFIGGRLYEVESSNHAGSRRSHSLGFMNPNPANSAEPNEQREREEAAQRERAEVAQREREQAALAARNGRVLHPSRKNGAKWFGIDIEVSTKVRKIIEGCFKGPWYSWKRVPQFYKAAWYSTFKTIYECDVSVEHIVKANFDDLAATRLKRMIIGGTPKAKEISEKARSARLFNHDGYGPHRHRSGSRSYAKVQDVLEANNEDSSFIAVMKKTHQKPDGTYVDERARIIAETYDEQILERLSEMESSNGEALIDSLTIEDRNEIYVKIAGISKQGRVFGLGSLQSGIPVSLNGSTVSPQATEEVGTLTRRVEELETELEKSRNENALIQKRLEGVEKLVETLLGQHVFGCLWF